MDADCTHPPALTDEALLRHLDDPSDSAVTAHLQTCAACGQRLAVWRRTTQTLTDRLYRHGCLAPEAFGDYQLGLLSPDERRNVEAHLPTCSACAAEMAATRVMLKASLDTSRDWLEPVRVLIASLAPTQRVLAAPALRGEVAARQQYQVDQLTILLEPAPLAAAPNLRSVRGSVLGLPEGEWRLEFWDAGRLTATAPVDDLGYFALESAPAGQYEAMLIDVAETLVVRLPGVQL